MDESTYREREKRLVRKLDRNVVPLVCVLFMLSFLDRSNVGNARTAGMATDLHFDANGKGPHTYDWLLNIFYISYILFEFLILGWKVVPPHIWGACVVLAWGVISTLQAATTNWSGMMALRFLLGVSEAAYGPGIVFYLTFFYLRHEVGFRQGMFLSFAPLATCFAGALAYGITREKGHVASWRLLFVVEGIPTVLMAPITWYFLPDSPHKARFLTAEEKDFAASREVRQVGTANRISGVSWKDAGATFLDPKAWMQGLMYFSCNTAYGSLPVFLPTFLSESLGFSAINAQGLTAPPYFFSFLLTFSTPWLADRLGQRGIIVAIMSIIGGVGYILLATATNHWVQYFGVFLAAGGVFPAISNILPWVTNNQGNDTRRGVAVVILNLIGQCGPVLGNNVYPTNDGPRYTKGHSVCAAFLFFNACLAMTLRTYLSWQNKKMDKKYGTLDEQRARAVAGPGAGEKVTDAQQVVDATDEKAKAKAEGQVAAEDYGPMFRYIL
ncbi:pantothenate transporter liz1 [Myriangium duriaei CBS 260.36]|uniref:Pantothenate transporter liz1 n=1 Tax=Myriangium duriaei CBS 260.36 TaxID=1168546 RepID=A0A9P4J832_9PEZI|nr:pantothenate transporter liz1 [Myriangium duriaei CBS 260.36]